MQLIHRTVGKKYQLLQMEPCDDTQTTTSCFMHR